jgi:hypothetical protein
MFVRLDDGQWNSQSLSDDSAVHVTANRRSSPCRSSPVHLCAFRLDAIAIIADCESRPAQVSLTTGKSERNCVASRRGWQTPISFREIDGRQKGIGIEEIA